MDNSISMALNPRGYWRHHVTYTMGDDRWWDRAICMGEVVFWGRDCRYKEYWLHAN